MAKLLEPGPVLVLTFQAQQVTVKSRGLEGEREVEEVSVGITYTNILTHVYLTHTHTQGGAREYLLRVGVVSRPDDL